MGDVPGAPLEEQLAALRDPATRKALVDEALYWEYDEGDVVAEVGSRRPDYDHILVLETATGTNPSIAEVAKARGCSPVDAVVDLSLEHSFDQFFLHPFGNRDLNEVREIISHPRTVIAGSDAGAHVSQVMESCAPTYLLAHWVRDTGSFSLEEAIQQITGIPAAEWGLSGRGRLAEGFAADVAVFDPATVAPELPSVVHDLPSGGRRLVQRAQGMHATVVNGAIVARDGEFSGRPPGPPPAGAAGAHHQRRGVDTAMSVVSIVSPDDHVIEPADLWQSRLPAKLRAEGPRVELHPANAARFHRESRSWSLEPGGDGPLGVYWRYEDKIKPVTRIEVAAGLDSGATDNTPVPFEEIREGCYEQKARLADMDANGVQASMCFPNYPRFSGQLFSEGRDRELGLACLQAYNDWMVDEWCAGSDGRLVPLCIVPLWDADLAAAEVRRNAARGVTAVSFTEIPAWLGVPSIHSGFWEPFFQACDETDTVVAMHIGSGSRILVSSSDAPSGVSNVMIFANSATSMLDYLTSGILGRYPNLKLLYAESQLGWIPYVLERADDIYFRQAWTRAKGAVEPPSSYYQGRVFSCFFSDESGVAQLDKIGEDQVLFETDYPHESGSFPKAPEVAAKELGHLDAAVQEKILRGNAIKLLRLPL